MNKLRPKRVQGLTEHRPEAGGFLLGPMVCSTFAVPTGGWASLALGQEGARTKCAEGEAQTWDGGVMGGVG